MYVDLSVQRTMPVVHEGSPLKPTSLRTALIECQEYPHIRVVRDYPVLRRIGQIRFRQYVEGQGKRYPSAVLDPDCLIELSDFSAVNIYATETGVITAGMRIGPLDDPTHPSVRVFLDAAERLGIDPRIALTCTRLVRDPGHPGSHAADLIRFVRLQTVHAGWRFCIMQTAERLIPWFQRFQFQPTGLRVDDPVAGSLFTMLLDTAMNPIQPKRSRP